MNKKIKIALAQLNPLVGDVSGNVDKLLKIRSELKNDVDLLVAPELYISGYPIDDLVLREDFLNLVEVEIKRLVENTKDGKSAIIFGAPRRDNTLIKNSVYVVENGKIGAIKDKYELPNTGVFDEQRIFSEGELEDCVKIKDINFGLPICEDIWEKTVLDNLSKSGAEIIIAINASPFTISKSSERNHIALSRVKETKLPLIYLNRTGGQDELIFDGTSFALNHDGNKFFCSAEFKEETSILDFERKNGKWIGNGNITKSSSEIERLYKALVLGLRDYVNNNKFPGVVLGLSGGIDSALVAAIATDAFGPSMVQSIMLPSNFTGQDSLNDAKDTANLLKINFSNLEINEAMKIVDKTLGKYNGKSFSPGITEENIQSRLRGLLLMALSNRYGYMVLATGNKSEYAVGYSTLYGDMCGGFAPIKDVWKTDVFKLCRWRNENFSELFKGPKGRVIPENIITKAPTAELRENQKDTDSLPEYEILDEILKGLVEKEISVEKIISKGFEREIVEKTAHLLARSEYKRFQSAPGPKVTSKAFGRDRRFPLTSGFRNWN
jgi:NAD+ synthase